MSFFHVLVVHKKTTAYIFFEDAAFFSYSSSSSVSTSAFNLKFIDYFFTLISRTLKSSLFEAMFTLEIGIVLVQLVVRLLLGSCFNTELK